MAVALNPQGVVWAQPEDEDALWEHLLGLHQENGLFPPSEVRTRQFIREATEQRGGMIGLIRSDRIEASIGMVLDQLWYSESYLISERWCYVHPDYRRKNHARRLVDFAKWCSDQLDTPLQMGIMSTSQTAAKERLYQRALTRVGGLFMYMRGVEKEYLRTPEVPTPEPTITHSRPLHSVPLVNGHGR